MQQTLGGGIEQLLESETPLFGNPRSVMGMQCVVVDLSSDDEDTEPGRSGGRDWVRPPPVEDSDDVVILDVSTVPASKRRSDNGKKMGVDKCGVLEVGDDDVCVVLDSDPNKPVSVFADHGESGRGVDKDMLIVAEKGQVACRDYPHSRHLCATYSFSSSPHERHCNLCHCYVCDSPAPCNLWGNGKLSTDHCHSNDKETSWNCLRELFRESKNVATHPLKLTDLVSVHLSNTVPARSIPLQPGITSFSNSVSTNQIAQFQRSFISSRAQRSSQQNPIRSYSLYPRVQPAQKEVRLAALTAQFMNSHTKSRRTGSTQVGLMSLNSRSTASSLNRIPGDVLHRSTTVSSLNPHCPRGLQGSQTMPVIDQMQTILSSPLTPSRQSSLVPIGAAEDICGKSWQDILASLASDLGVSNDMDMSIPSYQQPFSPSLPYGMPFSEAPRNPDQSFANYTAALNLEQNQRAVPHQPTAQMSNNVFLGSNTLSGENCPNSLLPSMDDDRWL